MKRFSKEQYRKWGKLGGSPLLRAYRQGRVSIDGKRVHPKRK
jgi:hypothetical protein